MLTKTFILDAINCLIALVYIRFMSNEGIYSLFIYISQLMNWSVDETEYLLNIC